MSLEQRIDDSETSPGGIFEVIFGFTLLVVGAVFFALALFIVYSLSLASTKSLVLLYLIVAIFSACSYLSFRAAIRLLFSGRESSRKVFTPTDLCIAGATFFISPIFIGYSLTRGMPLDGTELISVTFGPALAYLCFKLARQRKEKTEP